MSDCTSILIDYFNRHIPLNKEEEAAVKVLFKERRIRKRHYLLQEGDICVNNSFVVSGCFRMFMVDKNGKEHNLQFSTEDWWISDLYSLFKREPSKLYIEALENSIILYTTIDELLQLFEDYPTFSHIFRILTQNALASQQQRILQYVSSTAEERYLCFAQKRPELLHRISSVQIASYLGVTPEFLSTIRKKIAKS
ncbi:CRP-like cAMP-binding protein [Ulvibacter sp. MAR_2010_11]|uniref:Crp/Fnr family transcriptional regulator n=1 Tax=Ulvibacter sp. MAR_2010_11 TaxID=1250229 RepID=UPI000C2BC23A|nr:Crp/Fnr family transcriptional regulator [Ulvibacter sp. MAR_2010_11]PKA82016.1 CRP-like cAMP-binding protein [Ulvibacter sp. MAR_2010_11]